MRQNGTGVEMKEPTRIAFCEKCGARGTWLGMKFKCVSCQRDIPGSQIHYSALTNSAECLDDEAEGYKDMSTGIEKVVGLDKMNILQCEKLAQDIGFDGATFDLCGPKGRVKAKWLDAYMGLFQLEGSEGFLMSKQFQYAPDVWCENLMPA